MQTRTEHDSMGELQVPVDGALSGADPASSAELCHPA